MSARTFVLGNASQVDRLAAFLRAQLAEHPLSVAVDKWRKQRTTTANSRLWLLHERASEVTGYMPLELHHECCGEFFGWREGTLFGKPLKVPVRTTTTPDVLDSKRFAEFMTWVEMRYMEHLGVWLEDR